jgi:hypothetical protein
MPEVLHAAAVLPDPKRKDDRTHATLISIRKNRIRSIIPNAGNRGLGIKETVK